MHAILLVYCKKRYKENEKQLYKQLVGIAGRHRQIKDCRNKLDYLGEINGEDLV